VIAILGTIPAVLTLIQGKIVPVLHKSTTSWKRIGEWTYISTYSWPRN